MITIYISKIVLNNFTARGLDIVIIDKVRFINLNRAFELLQGVQMALPFLIISRIKKAAELTKRMILKKTESAMRKTSTFDLKAISCEAKSKDLAVIYYL